MPAQPNTSSFLFTPNKWYTEKVTPHFLGVSTLQHSEFTGKTKFQRMDILTLGSFGRCLVLDDEIQSSERDEFIYHESLVHPACIMAEKLERVLIAGGGEGATLREVLKYKSVKECVMVDIDGECVDMCKRYLQSHHNGAFDDPRTTLIIDDAFKYLQSAQDSSFDVIILDLADPVEGNPCFNLYADFFYKLCQSKLCPGGVLVTQSGPAGLLTYQSVFSPIHNTLKNVFSSNVHPYNVHVPSFVDDYGFNMVCLSSHVSSVSDLDPKWIDSRIEERLIEGSKSLKHYDGVSHRRMFNLGKELRRGLSEETRIISKDSYVYMRR